MGEFVGGEDRASVKVQGVSLRSVVRSVVVPHDRHVPAVVAQIVHREVVPIRNLDRVQLDLVVFTRNHTGDVLDDGPVGGTELGMVNPGAVRDLAAVLGRVAVLLRNGASGRIVVHVPELVLVRITVVAALVVGEGDPVQQLLVRLVGDVSVVGRVVVADAGRIDL